ncbi:MAG: hypothetical protein A3G23_03815 [Bacteroidetes bacterium RIFCSPLOWO2_12_FULL_37_12]|nr:MAG: hypothetical protein A3G23_03815 [Bacteroidetes bacterium RIFCSPLOWO2_12_FULL_37_12]
MKNIFHSEIPALNNTILRMLLFCFYILFANTTYAQDYSMEIKKMLATKEDVDISYTDLLGKTDDYYFLSGDSLYVKVKNILFQKYVCNLKEINYSKCRIWENQFSSQINSVEHVYSLQLEFLKGKNKYYIRDGKTLIPDSTILDLNFLNKKMAEQALVYLKQHADKIETKTGTVDTSRFDLFDFSKNDYQYKYNSDIENSESEKTVKIGTQTWTINNLNVSKFADGNTIPEAKTKEEWSKACNEKKPIWCYYDFKSSNGEKYGKLYNWYAVIDPHGLAPEGFHIPSMTEFSTLIKFLGFESALKLKSTSDWDVNDVDYEEDDKPGNGDNQSGFNGKPGGYYMGKGYEISKDIQKVGRWWSSTEEDISRAYYLSLSYMIFFAIEDNSVSKDFGLSIRCIKN